MAGYEPAPRKPCAAIVPRPDTDDTNSIQRDTPTIQQGPTICRAMAGTKKTSRQESERGREAGKVAGQPRSSADAMTLDAQRDALALESINHGVYDWDIPSN